jgi:hypothetical protein
LVSVREELEVGDRGTALDADVVSYLAAGGVDEVKGKRVVGYTEEGHRLVRTEPKWVKSEELTC